MGKKTGKSGSAKTDEMFVVGLDANGRPRGARFAELRDNIASAAMDMDCRVLITQPASVSAYGMKLPIGRVHGSGPVVKLGLPNIMRALYDQILEAARIASEQSEAQVNGNDSEQDTASGKDKEAAGRAGVRNVSPVVSGLPRSWEEVAVGHTVLMHESLDSGWWEATVIQREEDVLTLRLRDYPKQGTWIRHINTVALVNPGPI